MKLFFLALLLGLLSALAFAPVGWWPLMIVAVAGLAELIRRQQSLRGALGVGWAFGFGQFVIGLNWIATAFTYQAAMPAWLGWVAVVLLSLYLAVYPMLAAGLAWRFGRNRPLALVLALAGGWAVTEWLRATMFTGFAWNPLASIWVDTFVLRAAPWLGTYALSLLAVLAGAGLWWFVIHLRQELARKPLTPGRLAFIVAVFVAPEAIAIALAPQLFAKASAREAGGPAIRVVQPNIGQADKWRPGFERIAADRLATLTASGNRSATIIFWPEAAVTDPLIDERSGAEAFTDYERGRAVRSLLPGQTLVTGGLALTARDRRRLDGATNSVFVLGKDGAITGRYDKAHLVPYGEYLPMRPLLSAIGLSRLAPGDLDFRPGPGPRTLALGDGPRMGVQVCYEIIFSGKVADRGNRPDFLFNPSNDAWFGAWGPPQHLAQARLRAAEEGLPVVRATPTGISAVIDSAGGLVGTVAGGRAGVIDAALPRAAASTLFARTGNALPLGLGFALLLAAIVLGRGRRYSERI